MNRLLYCLAALLAALLLPGCDDAASSGSKEPFSVKFVVASVPRGLPLDGIEISIAVGDTGKPQALTVNTKLGVSKGTVQAYPGQTYTLSFKFFSGGFEIGHGESKGTFTQDMSVTLAPEWDNAKVDQAYASVHSGKYLPGYLEASFNLALAGKPLDLRVDSAAGKTYRWWVRMGDSVIAEGTGTLVDWTPADSLGGKKISIKIQVLSGSTVVDEKKWDVEVLAARLGDRLQGIATRNDTASAQGSLTWFKYLANGSRDSLLDFDTTAFIKDKIPVSTVGYSYATMAGKDYLKKAFRAYRNDDGIDSAFEYDSKGRLLTITVTLKSGTTVDSLFYGAAGAVETRSYAQGKLTRLLKHSVVSAKETVDSSFSRLDSALVLSRMVRSTWDDSLLLASRTFVNKGGMVPSASERYVYNGLGLPALHYMYVEGNTLELDKSETYAYGPKGNLLRVTLYDEVAGEAIRIQDFQYATGSPTPAPKLTAAQVENRGWLQRLSVFGASVPGTRTPTFLAQPSVLAWKRAF